MLLLRAVANGVQVAIHGTVAADTAEIPLEGVLQHEAGLLMLKNMDPMSFNDKNGSPRNGDLHGINLLAWSLSWASKRTHKIATKVKHPDFVVLRVQYVQGLSAVRSHIGDEAEHLMMLSLKYAEDDRVRIDASRERTLDASGVSALT